MLKYVVGCWLSYNVTWTCLIQHAESQRSKIAFHSISFKLSFAEEK
jgi:hypothetical protein